MMKEWINDYVQAQKLALDSIPAEAVSRLIERLHQALLENRHIFVFGNGGSAADAQHIAAELVSVLSLDFPRPALAAIALTTDSSILSAIANDFGFGGVFERQVEALGRPGDVIVGISTSGNSENVLRALRAARARGISTIALTGMSASQASEVADIAICVPSNSVQHIQESHITVGHIICAIVERRLADEAG